MSAVLETRPEAASARERFRRPVRLRWLLATCAVAVLVVLPVALVAASVLTPSTDVWGFLWRTSLPEMLVSTLLLLAGVVLGTLVLGSGLAWLVATYRFPGRSAFSWLLVLPLAVPAYVLGFVYVWLLDTPGPVQTGLRGLFGDDVWFPEVRSMAMVIVVLTLALYPYVYLLARAALAEQAAATHDAARTLGQGPLRVARRVLLPMARPSLAAGGALVAMETLTDYATVQYFNVETVSVGIYRVWNGMYDRAAATELASLVLVFAITIIVVERALRGRARYHQQGGGARGREPVRLRGWRAWTATGVCAAVVGVTFVIPAAQLLNWSSIVTLRSPDGQWDARYLEYATNSLLIAGAAALACLLLAAVVVNANRFGGDRLTAGLARLTTVGYAMPGPVVAVGVLVLFAALDAGLDLVGASWGGLLVTGSIVGLIYAYVVRFLAVSYNSLDASLEKVTPSMTASALTLGASPLRVVGRVHLPLIRSGIGVALVLVAIDALKELPIVLLLRPFGFETLAVWVYRLASESRWELAGLPALTIVAVATIPVAVLIRRSMREVDAR
ncbi:MAG: ABC transporter permease [Actinomycetota bacterium]